MAYIHHHTIPSTPTHPHTRPTSPCPTTLAMGGTGKVSSVLRVRVRELLFEFVLKTCDELKSSKSWMHDTMIEMKNSFLSVSFVANLQSQKGV